MDPLQIIVYIWMYISNIVREEFIEMSDLSLDFGDITGNALVIGTLFLTNLTITGFDTITNEINNINATQDDDDNNVVCITLPIGYLQFSSDYVADIGIADEIPIYGEGIISFGMDNIELSLCTFVNFNEVRVENTNAQLRYRHRPVQLTGFWKNEQVSAMLEYPLNIFNRLFAMWSAYEPRRTSCFISPILEYGLNIYMGKENNTLTFNTTCLEGFFFDDSWDLEEYLIEIEETEEDDEVKTFIEENRFTILELINPFIHFFRKVLSNEN